VLHIWSVVVSSIGTTSTFPDGLPSAADELLVEDFWVDVSLEAADFSADGEAADAVLESAEFPEESSWSDVSPDAALESAELPAESS
jgi:hypothetical protein